MRGGVRREFAEGLEHTKSFGASSIIQACSVWPQHIPLSSLCFEFIAHRHSHAGIHPTGSALGQTQWKTLFWLCGPLPRWFSEACRKVSPNLSHPRSPETFDLGKTLCLHVRIAFLLHNSLFLSSGLCRACFRVRGTHEAPQKHPVASEEAPEACVRMT